MRDRLAVALHPRIDPGSEITRLHERIERRFQVAFHASLVDALRIGELLTERKKELSHGEFLPWLEVNVPFSRRTAAKYMRVYAQKGNPELNTATSLTEAYRLISPPKKPRSNSKEDSEGSIDTSDEIFDEEVNDPPMYEGTVVEVVEASGLRPVNWDASGSSGEPTKPPRSHLPNEWIESLHVMLEAGHQNDVSRFLKKLLERYGLARPGQRI